MTTPNSQLQLPKGAAPTIRVKDRGSWLLASPFAHLARAARVGSWKLGVGSCVAALALLGLGATPEAQEPQRAAGTLKEGVTAVLVDVVVRDKRGQPVRDLTEADFELSRGRRRPEDWLVHANPGGAPAAPKTATAAAPAPCCCRAQLPASAESSRRGSRRSPPWSSTGWSSRTASAPCRRRRRTSATRRRCRTTSASSASTCR